MSKPKRQLAVIRDLFKPHFDTLLNPENLLLADKIDWGRFDADFGADFGDKGAPAKPTRLVVGLHYLKYLNNLGDDLVIERWLENPYWQCFCGFNNMQHELPADSTTLTKWRNRFGADKFNSLLDETISVAKREKFVSKHELKHVTVDSTVQEKNITHPTDSKLLYKCIVLLGKARKKYGVKVRQSYIRVAKTTIGNWIISCRLAEGNPCDGHTLEQTIIDIESVTSIGVTEIYLDKGYKGHDYKGDAMVHISGNSTEELTKAQINRAKGAQQLSQRSDTLKMTTA